jgi:hypothetical protein
MPAEVFGQKMRDLTLEMGQMRNREAEWSLKSFALQFSRARQMALCEQSDVSKEFDALVRLLMAAFQKICLPGSVSRHRYSKEVFQEFHNLLQEMSDVRPHDASLILAKTTVGLCLHKVMPDEFRASLEGLSKSGHGLGFEMTHLLKMTSWKLPFSFYKEVVSCYFGFAFEKLLPDRPQSYWWEMLLDTLTMPKTYPSVQDSEVWHTQLKGDNPKVSLFSTRVLDMLQNFENMEVKFAREIYSVLSVDNYEANSNGSVTPR